MLKFLKGKDDCKFTQIYNNYRKTMFFVAREILSSNESAEDAVHIAFERILQNLDKIEISNYHKIRKFVVVIVRNIAIDMYNKEKNKMLCQSRTSMIYLMRPQMLMI